MQETLRIVFHGRNLRVIARRVGSKKTIVTFDHYTPGKCGFELFKPARWVCGKDLNEIRIQTNENDWFLNEDLDPAIDSIRQEILLQRNVTCVGFSMGAFAAILIGSHLQVNYIVAISPQFSPLGRGEGLHQDNGLIGRADLANLVPGCQRNCQGAVLFDPLIRQDDWHAERIGETFPSIDIVPLPGGGHPATRRLRANGNLGLLKDIVRGRSNDLRALQNANLSQGQLSSVN
jgi:hypothetical protein